MLVEENFTHIGSMADLVHILEAGSDRAQRSLQSSPPTAQLLRPISDRSRIEPMTNIVAIIASGLVYGSIYGLVAIGMTLIYGTLRILDMSQGSMVMIGGYVGWWALAHPRHSIRSSRW